MMRAVGLLRSLLLVLLSLTVGEWGCDECHPELHPPDASTALGLSGEAGMNPGLSGEAGMILARSNSPLPLEKAWAEVRIAPDRVEVDGVPVVSIKGWEAVYDGAQATAWDYHIRPLWEPIAKRSKAFEAADGRSCCEIGWAVATIVVHRDVLFSLLTRVLGTVGQSRLISYQLPIDGEGDGPERAIRLCMVRFDSGSSRCWGDYWESLGFVRRPFRSSFVGVPDGGLPPPPLNLMVILRTEGFSLHSSSGQLPGLEDDEGQLTVPLLEPRPASCEGGPVLPPTCAYDYAALAHMARRIKARHPEEMVVLISAESRLTWQHLAQAIDALRGTEQAPLFPLIVVTSGVD